VLAVADHHRRETNGDVVTFVVNRNINFTNRCFVGCKFCNFKVREEGPSAYLQDLEEVARRADEAVERGATELCIQGAHKEPPAPTTRRSSDDPRATRACTSHAFFPRSPLRGEAHGPHDPRPLTALRDGARHYSRTAAEILVDEVRRRLSPTSFRGRLDEVVGTAHRSAAPLSSTIMFGHVEEPRHWSRHLSVIRDLQKETGGFTEFVPLAFVHTLTPLFREGNCRPGATDEEKLKMYAVGRIFLRGHIDNVQVSWPKLGPAMAQRCLDAGANDFGGTLMEESISRMAGAEHGQYVSPDAFRQMIHAIGRIPAQRSTLYDLLRIFPQQGRAGVEMPRRERRPQAPPRADERAAPLAEALV
jgi:2-iminoacetate synthase ThiH